MQGALRRGEVGRFRCRQFLVDAQNAIGSDVLLTLVLAVVIKALVISTHHLIHTDAATSMMRMMNHDAMMMTPFIVAVPPSPQQ